MTWKGRTKKERGPRSVIERSFGSPGLSATGIE